LLVALLALLGLDWALGRDGDGRGLLKTGIGLCPTVLALFFISVPQDQWWSARPDALSIFYVALLLLTAAGFGSLFLASRYLPQASGVARTGAASIVMRTSAGLAAATAIVALMVLLFPDIFTGGIAGVSPELQARWLSDIIEAKSLAEVLAIKPGDWLSTVAYSLVLIAAGAVVLWRVPESKQHVIAIYGMMVLSIAASLFQYRLLRAGIVASIPICVVFFHLLLDALKQRSMQSRPAGIAMMIGATVLMLPPTWLALALAIPDPQARAAAPAAATITPAKDMAKIQAAEKTGWRNEAIYPFCNRASQFAALNSLPKGLVINDLNSAPPILVFTKHDVLAGNYHRNGRAILQTLDFFETSLAKARTIARTLRADYVALCDPGTPVPAGPGQDGKLGVHILNGTLPNWLQRVSPDGDRLIVLKIVK
jgi:hypothetical protein